MINRQIATVSATISAKVAGDVGRFDAGLLGQIFVILYTSFTITDASRLFLYVNCGFILDHF